MPWRNSISQTGTVGCSLTSTALLYCSNEQEDTCNRSMRYRNRARRALLENESTCRWNGVPNKKTHVPPEPRQVSQPTITLANETLNVKTKPRIPFLWIKVGKEKAKEDYITHLQLRRFCFFCPRSRVFHLPLSHAFSNYLVFLISAVQKLSHLNRRICAHDRLN